eukprot:g4460.t1
MRPLSFSISISIPTTSIVEKNDSLKKLKFTIYHIYIKRDSHTYTIFRRYSDFVRLRVALVSRSLPGSSLNLPPKSWFNNFDPQLIENRRVQLEEYLRAIVAENDDTVQLPPPIARFMDPSYRSGDPLTLLCRRSISVDSAVTSSSLFPFSNASTIQRPRNFSNPPSKKPQLSKISSSFANTLGRFLSPSPGRPKEEREKLINSDSAATQNNLLKNITLQIGGGLLAGETKAIEYLQGREELRLWIGTWNICRKCPSKSAFSPWLPYKGIMQTPINLYRCGNKDKVKDKSGGEDTSSARSFDVVALGLQEIERRDRQLAIDAAGARLGSSFTLIALTSELNVAIAIWIRSELVCAIDINDSYAFGFPLTRLRLTSSFNKAATVATLRFRSLSRQPKSNNTPALPPLQIPSLCFINVHLAAHEGRGEDRTKQTKEVLSKAMHILYHHRKKKEIVQKDEKENNPVQWNSIKNVAGALWSSAGAALTGTDEMFLHSNYIEESEVESPDSVVHLQHKFSHTFFFGDLNYRIDLALTKQLKSKQENIWSLADVRSSAQSATHRQEVRKLVAECIHNSDFSSLLDADELNFAIRAGKCMHGFSESSISFPPTFKLQRKKRNEKGKQVNEQFIETEMKDNTCTKDIDEGVNFEDSYYTYATSSYTSYTTSSTESTPPRSSHATTDKSMEQSPSSLSSTPTSPESIYSDYSFDSDNDSPFEYKSNQTVLSKVISTSAAVAHIAAFAANQAAAEAALSLLDINGDDMLQFVAKRTPSYCDRILFSSLPSRHDMIQCFDYSSPLYKDSIQETSDHCPVHASFRIRIREKVSTTQKAFQIDKENVSPIATEAIRTPPLITNAKKNILRVRNLRATIFTTVSSGISTATDTLLTSMRSAGRIVKKGKCKESDFQMVFLLVLDQQNRYDEKNEAIQLSMIGTAKGGKSSEVNGVVSVRWGECFFDLGPHLHYAFSRCTLLVLFADGAGHAWAQGAIDLGKIVPGEEETFGKETQVVEILSHHGERVGGVTMSVGTK